MFIEINPFNIDTRLINQAVQCFKSGGIVIIPTDSVYAIGCDLRSKKGLQKLADFKGVKLNKANFSFDVKKEFTFFIKISIRLREIG